MRNINENTAKESELIEKIQKEVLIMQYLISEVLRRIESFNSGMNKVD